MHHMHIAIPSELTGPYCRFNNDRLLISHADKLSINNVKGNHAEVLP